MVKRSDDDWQQLFNEQAQSGLSAAAFCRGKGLCPKYFSLRRKQLGVTPGKATPPSFVPIQVTPSTLCIEIRWQASTVIRLPTSLTPQWVSDFLRRLYS